ncbi:fungal hydrophobin [Phellopilus nigrolimitatus]|nr:fungal hydrophobin [Phellopilus nigrolimitatus]
MKFARLTIALALPLLAVATPWATTTKPVATTTVTVTATPTATTVSQCNTGPIQCCQSVQSSSSSEVGLVSGLLGVVLQGVDVPVGLTCSPLSVIGVGGGSSCTAQPVCCEGNSFSGLIVIGCSPININL